MRRIGLAVVLALSLLASLAAAAQQAGIDKPEFKLSIVVREETSWSRAASRFADTVRYRSAGRIQIKSYFDGRLFAGQQTTEFALLHRFPPGALE